MEAVSMACGIKLIKTILRYSYQLQYNNILYNINRLFILPYCSEVLKTFHCLAFGFGIVFEVPPNPQSSILCFIHCLLFIVHCSFIIVH